MTRKLLVTTGDAIDGAHIVEYLGVVRGIAVRVPSLSQGFQALGNVLKGNMQAGAEMYVEVSEQTRAEAFRLMAEHAKDLGADAVIAMRYDATEIGEAASEILAYGTAVKLKYPEAIPITPGASA